jgi:hypothetical protein
MAVTDIGHWITKDSKELYSLEAVEDHIIVVSNCKTGEVRQLSWDEFSTGYSPTED